jgi:hypothetical protein
MPLDLDLAAAEIEKRRSRWSSAGFTVGPLTWRDPGAWPYPYVSRDLLSQPDSVGVRCTRADVEFGVVLWPGGWADVEVANLQTGEMEVTTPDVSSIGDVSQLLDALFERWSGLGD